MNGMEVTTGDVRTSASNVGEIAGRYNSTYKEMYETLRSSMGFSGSGLIWYGNRAGQTLNDANSKEEIFTKISDLLVQAETLLTENARAWDEFDS